MLFNSYGFVLVFLPATLLVFFALGASGARRAALAWLVFVSFVFYAWWRPAYLLLLVASIAANYGLGVAIARLRGTGRLRAARGAFVGGIVLNLGALAYFKYADFLLANLNHVAPFALPYQHVVLPLAISFFTFNQIAFLADTCAGIAAEYDFLNYALFVSFFPHLIAGPIVHHKEMIPQFRSASLRYDHDDMMAGVTIFVIGLCKKVVVADALATYADPAFGAAARGTPLTFAEAWLAALTYGLQLYYDFSGYSDMAIGLARMFGIRFPLNFYSPYQATSISDFWRRWHMTLSRFLRDYLYIPLGGNRRGTTRRYVNLMVTMLLGGLWHGAAWTFVLWGGLHGVCLCVHQLWTAVRRRLGLPSFAGRGLPLTAARALTFGAVIFAWVPFRANNLTTALGMWRSMIAPNSARTILGAHGLFPHVWISPLDLLLVMLVAAAALGAPNTEQIMRRYGGSLGLPPGFGADPAPWWRAPAWTPSVRWGIGLGLAAAASVVLLVKPHVFLYYNF